MDFLKLASERYSCRKYDKEREIPKETLDRILEAGRLSPSACNGQPYHLTVCHAEAAHKVAKEVMGMGMNKFASDAPVLLVISEEDYVPSAALGAKIKKNDYRSIDIGIFAAYLTAAAASEGVGSCILGWFNDEKIREICGISKPVRLVITLGYPLSEGQRTDKKRKSKERLITYKS